MFRTFSILGIADIIGSILPLWSLEAIGRKNTLLFSCVIGGLTSYFTVFIPEGEQNLSPFVHIENFIQIP